MRRLVWILLIMFQTVKTVLLRPGRAMKWVFWIAVATIAYSYVGYAVWLWLRSLWSPRRYAADTAEPAVSAVMVVRNEEAVLVRKLENLLTLDYPPEKLDVVVVSDGSSDGTASILKDFGARGRVRRD